MTIRISFRDEATTDYDLDDASKMVPLLLPTPPWLFTEMIE